MARRACIAALAISSAAGLNVARLSAVTLKPVVDGRAVSEGVVTAGSLWKDTGAVVFAVRRAG